VRWCASASGRSWNPFSLTTYQQYFDVDTMDVYNRCAVRRCVATGPRAAPVTLV
jgi:hypothetical protein